MTPGSPNEQGREFSLADGSFDIQLDDNLPADYQMPNYRAEIRHEFGGSVKLLATGNTSDFLLLDSLMNPGHKRLMFLLRAADLILQPGSYVLVVINGNREVFRRSLSAAPRA